MYRCPCSGALLFGRFPQLERTVLTNVRFSDLVTKVKETGAKEVLLYLDEIQFDRALVKNLYEACDFTMRNPRLGLAVVPLASGLTGPSFRTLPSGGHVDPIEMEPFQLDNSSLRENFCTAIDVAVDSLSTCPNLLALFTLCGGRPNLIDIVIQVIKDRRKVSALTLPIIPVNEAEDVFNAAVQEASVTNAYFPRFPYLGFFRDAATLIRGAKELCLDTFQSTTSSRHVTNGTIVNNLFDHRCEDATWRSSMIPRVSDRSQQSPNQTED